MFTKPTGSGFERVWNCVASAVLPQTRTTGEASLGGVKNHTTNERYALGDRSCEVAPVVKELLDGATVLNVEPAFVMNLKDELVVPLGDRIGRDYVGRLRRDFRQWEVALSTDLVCTRGDHVWVVDYKSRKRVTEARNNLQLRSAVECVRHELELDNVVGAIVYLDTGEVDSHLFSTDESRMVWSHLGMMLTRLQNAWHAYEMTQEPPEQHTGPWCDYCPALLDCPAQKKLVRSVLPELATIEERLSSMEPIEVGRAAEMLDQIDKLSEKVWSAIKLQVEARGGSVPLPSGKFLKVWRHPKAGPDWGWALRTLKEMGVAVPQKTSEVFDSRVVSKL